MLKESLIAKTRPLANEENFVYWADYRVTVLSDRLFRIEKSKSGNFRDEATQAVWFRDAEKQEFDVEYSDFNAVIDTGKCKLILYRNEGQVCVELDGVKRRLDNYGNLLGTHRTLDGYDGGDHVYDEYGRELETPQKIELCKGVCSKTGVAVLEDDSLPLSDDGQVKNVRADGSDRYVFVFGDDYLGAVKALYSLTGYTPLVPRFALGNWWSRYHAYTDKEYLRLLNEFEEREIPLTVATVDMDWHYSDFVDEQCKITESGKNTEEYVGKLQGALGWTGYTWNENLFPDYKGFLKAVKEKNLKITLNVHPSDGVRFWEEAYGKMAGALGKDPSEQKQIAFDFSYDRFINAYFDLLHKPYELDGVDFWWIDWQQADIAWHDERPEYIQKAEPFEKYDPLWALNHYHYLDNGEKKDTPLILSRYAGIGSHRYPLGFSGDTFISWKTLAFLPYFTATASNIGYTWWSHDIGGHQQGEKSDELYLRHLQYGVFSPINRLHCSATETMTKEPWAYLNGTGLIAEKFLRFRHQMIPYLYTASYETHANGTPLIQPLYYQWKTPQAYAYKEEYTFGSQLLVAPVTQKSYADGYARVKAWIPQGKWTDIFTGEEYETDENGKELTFLRTKDSIPVLAKSGAILPLSLEKGNSVKNPEKLEIKVYEGNGAYTLYEDGKEEGKEGTFFTEFTSQYTENDGACTQSLTVKGKGDSLVLPQNRTLLIRFERLFEGEVSLFIDGEQAETEEVLTSCTAVRFAFEPEKEYKIEVSYRKKTKLQKIITQAKNVLLLAEGENNEKSSVWNKLQKAESENEYLSIVEESKLPPITKLKLKESL
ncbi:MAG: DUF4968 domain-containing protein [Clostridia bacterium]|nr:DUF4968 domain-containing protein [Clostridia bacterium]